MVAYRELSEDERARYADHLHEFPLESIRDDAHLDRATEKIDGLLDQPELAPGDEVYLNALSDLVALYEAEHVVLPEVGGVEVLRHLMEEHDLQQKDLVPIFGSKSTVSEVLRGKRPLTLAHIVKLSERFAVPADVFIDRTGAASPARRPVDRATVVA